MRVTQGVRGLVGKVALAKGVACYGGLVKGFALVKMWFALAKGWFALAKGWFALAKVLCVGVFFCMAKQGGGLL